MARKSYEGMPAFEAGYACGYRTAFRKMDEFCQFIAEWVVDETWALDETFAEKVCRRLVDLGYVVKKDGYYYLTEEVSNEQPG